MKYLCKICPDFLRKFIQLKYGTCVKFFDRFAQFNSYSSLNIWGHNMVLQRKIYYIKQCHIITRFIENRISLRHILIVSTRGFNIFFICVDLNWKKILTFTGQTVNLLIFFLQLMNWKWLNVSFDSPPKDTVTCQLGGFTRYGGIMSHN